MKQAFTLTYKTLVLILCLSGSTVYAGQCEPLVQCPKQVGVNYVRGHCAPYIKRSHEAPWLKSACEASYKKSCGEAPYLKTVGSASYRKSCGEAHYIKSSGQASFVKGCGLAPIIKSVCEPPCYPPEQKEPTPLCVISNGCPSR
jgi:hypothetical protein